MWCFTFLLVLFASAQPIPDSLLEVYPSVVRFDQTLVLVPATGHKLNLKSKNHCGEGSLLQIGEQEAHCQMNYAGVQRLEIYVCDLKNTYCKREELSVLVEWPGSLWNKLAHLKDRLVHAVMSTIK